MSFPVIRMRRLRKNQAIRSLVRETVLTKNDLILPLFVCPGVQVKNPIGSMPGVYQMSIDVLVEHCRTVVKAGIHAILLFGIPEYKDEMGSSGYDDDGIVQRAIRAIKQAPIPLMIITDVCNCEYTSHGHCGHVIDGETDNDLTLEMLGKQALSHAKAGVDMIAPSDMMDGRVGYLRNLLDKNGYSSVPIMAYSVKYASVFYGPFRDAAGSAPQYGDRKSYQMDPANSDEALREAELDINEGADIIMVKPALSYLDVIQRVKKRFGVPVAAYNVSGEYSMIKAAAEKGWIDEKRAVLEMLTSIKRAGADIIITYYALEAAEMIGDNCA